MSQSHDPMMVPDHLIHPISLIRCKCGWIAVSACERGRPGPSFPPFQLPLPPRQRLDWLVVAGHRFWNRHQRGMVALLLINCHTRHWNIAWPSQKCSKDAARWSQTAARSPGSSAMVRIGGTFRVIAPEACPPEHVPPQAGLHFVLRPFLPCPLSAFVRDNTGLKGADVHRLLADDWAEAVDAAMPRLRLD